MGGQKLQPAGGCECSRPADQNLNQPVPPYVRRGHTRGTENIKLPLRLRFQRAPEGRELSLHPTNRPLHVFARLVLNVEFLVNGGEFGRKCLQRVAALGVRQFWPNTLFRSAQLFDAAHRVMDGAQLCFELRKEIQLISGEHFCFRLECRPT